MKKKILALVLLVAVLCGLAACAGTGRVKAILISGNWTISGAAYLRFYPDGTGMRYEVRDDYAETRLFDWELEGNKLSLQWKEDDIYLDSHTYVILSYSEYTLDLMSESGVTYTYCKGLKN